MTPPEDIIEDLRKYSKVCHDLLAIVEREGQTLRRSDKPSLLEFCQARKNLLPRLNQSLECLRRHRAMWQKLS